MTRSLSLIVAADAEHLHADVELSGGGSGIVNAWLKLLGQRGALVSMESSILLTQKGN